MIAGAYGRHQLTAWSGKLNLLNLLNSIWNRPWRHSAASERDKKHCKKSVTKKQFSFSSPVSLFNSTRLSAGRCYLHQINYRNSTIRTFSLHFHSRSRRSSPLQSASAEKASATSSPHLFERTRECVCGCSTKRTETNRIALIGGNRFGLLCGSSSLHRSLDSAGGKAKKL